MKARWKDPITIVLAAAFLIRVVGITWGLPAADGWDDDGVAPRDFLVGLVETFTPGHFYTYPPFHLILLAVATSPVWIFKLLTAPALSPEVLVTHFTTVNTMTAFALCARLLSLAMSLGTLRAVSLIAREMAGRKAEVATAVVIALNWSLTYYAHTSNLDGPYLFWGALSVLFWTRALSAGARADYLRASVFAAFAVATKDQAYALFLIAYPVSLVLLLGLERTKPDLRNLALALGVFVGLLLVLDGAPFNPRGFYARLMFLRGSASQDHAYYANTWMGRKQILQDLAQYTERFYPPLAFAALTILGIAQSRTTRRLVPLLVAASFTIAFNFVARRTEHRFELPQSIFLAPYAGVGAAWLLDVLPRAKRALLFAFTVFALHGVYLCVAVDVALLQDPRYAVEAWLKTHTQPGDTVELYGNNVYLPRIPAHMRATRILGMGETPRNPIPGIEDLTAPFEQNDTRKPMYIVVPSFWVWRYLRTVETLPAAYIFQPIFLEHARDQASRSYFQTLTSGQGAYERVFTGRFESEVFPMVDIHASTTREVWIFRRKQM